MLPGPHFEERQQLPGGLHKKRKENNLLFARHNQRGQAVACVFCVDKAHLSVLSNVEGQKIDDTKLTIPQKKSRCHDSMCGCR